MQNNEENKKPKKAVVNYSLILEILGVVVSILSLIIALIAWIVPFQSSASKDLVVTIVVGIIITFSVLILTFSLFLSKITGEQFVELLKKLLETKKEKR